MRKLILTAGFIFAAITASAQQYPTRALNTSTVNISITKTFACEGTNCIGLTIDNTAGGIALTAANYQPALTTGLNNFQTQAQRADCYNSGAKIWVTSNPNITLVSGRGKGIPDQGYFTIYGIDDIKNFKAIRDASSSSTLYCDYSRQP